MRNHLDFNSQSFISEVEKSLKKYSDKLFRSSAADNPKWLEPNFENSLVLKTRKLDDLVLLTLFSYYVPEELGVLLRLELQEVADRNPEVEILHFLLQGKGLMFCYLCDTNLWSTRDFFGNILNEKKLKRIQTFFAYRFKTKRRPKRVQRHRGYRDKGTLKENHEYHSFVSYTKEMKELEEQRMIQKDTLTLLQGFLE